MESILSVIRLHPAYQQLFRSLRGVQRVGSLGLPRAARLPLVAALHRDLGQPILWVTDRADHAIAQWEELGIWTEARRLLYSEPAPMFYEAAPWNSAARRDRVQALLSLIERRLPMPQGDAPPIVVASARALMAKTVPADTFMQACWELSRGQAIPLDTLRRDLHRAGYERVNTVLEAGQIASRGGILDLWPPANPWPVRVDFFGDVIEALRAFDPASQRTLEALESILVTPARESIGIDSPSGEDPGRFADSEFNIPLRYPTAAGILDYLGEGALALVDDLTSLQSMTEELEEQAVQMRRTSIEEGTITSDFPLPYLTWSEIQDHLDSVPGATLGHSDGDAELTEVQHSALASAFRHDERFGGRLKPFMDYLSSLTSRGQRVTVVTRQRARLEDLWQEARDDQQPSASPLIQAAEFVDASLREGFVFENTHLITDAEIFGWERPATRWRERRVAEAPEAIYGDLKPGDLVVHIDHGIGRYLGLVSRNLDGHSREFLTLEYDDGGQLYVPVHQADRLTRYVGAEGLEPALDRLGGQEWHDKKGRVAEAVIKIAQDMLDLYAQREVARGYAFPKDAPWQAEVEASFPYVETADQLRALSEIKRDMETSRPMDRLLCGDVGYGKTELALRAAFKAVMGGKQVAVLVPTTVLAQQHFETFQARLATFPVKVEMLSRFRSSKEQSEVLAGLGRGEIDIVIGTHRLLSADVGFKDLGLVIIDEEQRFGVSHKEHLKKLRTEVDVLTLTATPIPRTLYMALTGVRDISNLNTPPEERLPIVTHVGPYSPKLARQAILRELERGGQIFFVHNRVNTIEAMRLHLSQLVPEARIDVGHGQMPEHELEDVMHRFNHGHTDVLLSTTIIESGLDIPNANTLIVDRADTFGLAQLYQLRGRVGRGAARAYAYFFRHRRLSPTLDAQQRLEVIAENTELGAGYSIAMRDLEIRGAGDLLGTHQHGHIQAVGFHLYTRLLADAVRSKRAAQRSASDGRQQEAGAAASWEELARPIAMPASVDLPLGAGVPADYIADNDLRLRLYRRIADLRDEREVEALASEFADRFGPLPEAVKHLLYQMRVKIRAEAAGLSSVSWESGQIILRYPTGMNGMNGSRLPDLGPGVRGGKGAYWCSFGKEPGWMPRLLDVLHLLVNR